jgi:hypothetical protein
MDWTDLELERVDALLAHKQITYQEWLYRVLRMKQICDTVKRDYQATFGEE